MDLVLGKAQLLGCAVQQSGEAIRKLQEAYILSVIPQAQIDGRLGVDLV